MLRNYFKTAWRNLVRGRQYSLINIFGLAIGSAVCLLIMLYVIDEWTFDRFHTKSDRIYRSWVREHWQGEVFWNVSTPYILGETLEGEVPEVEAMTRITGFGEMVRQGNTQDEETIFTVDPGFFEMFNFPIVQGQLFRQKHEMLITPEIAGKYFGAASPVGKTLTIAFSGAPRDFLVTGIIQEPPSNSSIRYDILIPFENNRDRVSENAWNNWQSVTPETYVLLREGTTQAAAEGKIQPLIDRKLAENFKPGEYEVGLQPLTDIHLNSDFPQGIAPVSNWRYPYILTAIALLILLLAGINFTTLSVARSLQRSREVGVRKVTGASRWQLMGQFWSEAILTALLAMIIGVALVLLLLPAFNELSQKTLQFPMTITALLGMLGLAVLVGLLSGVYPALVISGFTPLKAIRSQSAGSAREARRPVLRTLIAFQFVLSIALIASTLIMQLQLGYLQHKDLGFDREQLFVVPYSGAPTQEKRLFDIYGEGVQKAERFRQEIAGAAGMRGMTVASHAFSGSNWAGLGYVDKTETFRRFRVNVVDENYVPTVGLELLAGRNFNKENGADVQSGIIINEALAKMYGWSDPVGQFLPEPFQQFQIIGLVRDFNFRSLHTEVEPALLVMNGLDLYRAAPDMVFEELPLPNLVLRLSGEDIAATVNTIQSTWKQVAPDQTFNYYFVDESLDEQYRAEMRLSKMVSIATLLAILIAGLGLFGMATLTIIRRTKEIGIRKVLGASVSGIVGLLAREFVILALIALVIAAPLAYWAMNGWLENFAYHIEISWWVFGLTGLLAVLIVFVTVSLQGVRAALSTPIEALRQE